MLVLTLVVIALGITLEPIPFTAFALILASKNGVSKAAFFISGWILSLAVVVAAALFATENKPPKPNTAPSTAMLAVKIVLGAVLLFIAVRRWRKMGQPKKPKAPPKWQTGMDDMSKWFALALGPLTQPWGLVAAGVAVIVDAKLGSWQSWLALVVFCLLSTATYLAAEIYAWVRPEQTQEFLRRVRAWITGHTDQAIIGISGIVGLWLIADSVYVLAT
jgi:threonine/homoserine/homoserine lactone efflux protein